MNFKMQMVDLKTGSTKGIERLFVDEEFDALEGQTVFQLQNEIEDFMTLDIYVDGIKKREKKHFYRENQKEQIIFHEPVHEGAWVVVRHWFHQ